MNLTPYNMGACGMVQMMHIGKIAFDSTSASTGVKLGKVPKNTIITKAVCVVSKAFNAGTTNVVILGTAADDDALMASADVTEGTAGAYSKNTWLDVSAETELIAKYTETGTAATSGEAEFYVEVVRMPE